MDTETWEKTQEFRRKLTKKIIVERLKKDDMGTHHSKDLIKRWSLANNLVNVLCEIHLTALRSSDREDEITLEKANEHIRDTIKAGIFMGVFDPCLNLEDFVVV